MTQSGYSFTPGKYDTTEQIDVVPEQEKSNARILASEEQFLEEMNARDDALVENSKLTKKRLTKMLNQKVNIYLDAEEAVKLGIADIII